ncbi:MAG: 3'-5' exonuclease, partial [Rhodospirillaceae bacterium]
MTPPPPPGAPAGDETSDVILERLMVLHPKLIDLSLGRVEALLEKLGHPERSLPPTVHIAGTNGKGSVLARSNAQSRAFEEAFLTARIPYKVYGGLRFYERAEIKDALAYLRAILEAAGRRVHVYTSPHLVRFHERIRVAGELIDEGDLAAFLAGCEVVNGGEPITFFEITTAAAYIAFAEVPADVLLLETGLGGRLDATNVIAKPKVTVITPISLDHRQFLGDTLAAIAWEKAGIIKPGIPCVVARQEPDAFAAIQARA